MKRKPEFESVMFRLKKALAIGNDKELCARLGLTPSAFSNRKGTNSIPYDNVLELAGTENMNLNWLFWGDNPAKSDTDTSYLPIDIEGALIDESLLGGICMRIEQVFLSDDDLVTAIGMQKAFDFYYEHRDNMDAESREILSSLLEVEKFRRFDEALDKGVAAASVYNEVIKKKPGKDAKLLKPFIDEEVRRYINFLKLIKIAGRNLINEGKK
jgi:hypothetical protein